MGAVSSSAGCLTGRIHVNWMLVLGQTIALGIATRCLYYFLLSDSFKWKLHVPHL